ncbi:hypothetical protein CRV08_05685 [Halarcobacter ebronensis]|uniref:Uncharacterized protein n=1 Tax=Halarcobacter ebronensis TaxID=1462615 RepID=A0A4Q0YEH6_9BACT|nr:hypothetical protein [Halarcobacter ebronensis]RXJ68926.1 hypothetical protein CRV08_05685 [Halarcobacter ebronensis]
MKNLILIIAILSIKLFAFETNVKQMFAIGIFDENGVGENIQNVRKTKRDYNGTCYTKIFLRGEISNTKPTVKIGDSIGHYENSEPITNKNNIIIGKIITFKHYTVTNGVIEVFLGKDLYDARVFVK